MSDQDLDKLFKNKLEDHSEEPSAHTWDRIRSSVKEERGYPWMKIAAAVIVICLAGFLVWFAIPDQPAANLSDNKKTLPDTIVDAPESNITSSESEAQGTIQEDAPPVVQKDNALAETTENEQPKKAEKNQPKEVIETPMPDKPVSVEKAEVKDLIAQNEVKEPVFEKSTPQKTQVSGQTLAFSSDDFDQAERVAAQVSNKEEEEEGLKKVWSLLKQVKEPEAGFGELRELKNNILAFGNTKEKKATD